MDPAFGKARVYAADMYSIFFFRNGEIEMVECVCLLLFSSFVTLSDCLLLKVVVLLLIMRSSSSIILIYIFDATSIVFICVSF